MGCFFYCIFGISKDIIFGLIVIMLLMVFVYGMLENFYYIVVLILFSGIILFVMGFFCLGFVVNFILIFIVLGFMFLVVVIIVFS